MAETYTQLNIHAVFAVKGRENLLSDNLRKELFPYISGILKKNGAFPLAVGGWKDHVHVFFELPPDVSISKMMQIVKSSSSKWINEENKTIGTFAWQRGYGAFSHARSQRDTIIRYIFNQEDHHKSKPFRKEYLEMLIRNDVVFDERYVFEFYED